MATNNLIIEEKQVTLGNFTIGRLLPFRKKRQVGPFTFIDHMGPTQLGNGKYIDVDQHPHTGLSTLTYLFEGEIEHKDSSGGNAVITPGDVGFMTSGKGVTHTERTPERLRNGNSFKQHGYQIWIALPPEKESMEPNFLFVSKNDIPSWTENEVNFKLIVGEAFGKESPLKGYSPLFMLDIKTKKRTTLNLKNKINGEVGLIVVKGNVLIDNKEFGQGKLIVSNSEENCSLCLDIDTQILLFGGEPLSQEPRLMWNFVGYSKETLMNAKLKWQNKEFPQVEGDNTYIPFPEPKKS